MIKIHFAYNLHKLVAIIFIIVLFFVAFYNGIVVRHYTIKTKKILSGSLIRIVLVSDLHCKIYGKNQNYIKKKIEAQNPDIIVLAGDIVDDNAPIEGAELFIKAIKDIAPISCNIPAKKICPLYSGSICCAIFSDSRATLHAW